MEQLFSVDHDLWYEQAAKTFEEALPLGNGKLGLMDYGNGEYLINEETLWSGQLGKKVYHQDEEVLSKVRSSITKGDIQQGEALIEQELLGPWKESYLPFGKVKITLDGDPIRCNQRSLNLKQGLCTTLYPELISESFVSKEENLIILALNFQEEVDTTRLGIHVEPSLDYSKESKEKDGTFIMGTCPSSVPSYERYKEPLVYDLEAKTIQYVFGYKAVYLKNKVIVYMTVITNYKAYGKLSEATVDDLKDEARISLNHSSYKTYQDIYKAHVQGVEALYHKNTLTVLSNKNSGLATDIRRLRFREDPTDHSLMALYYHYGRYLLHQCSSGTSLPANLQGLWNEHVRAPWCSNYTTNINLEMNYWHSEVCQLEDANEALMKLLTHLSVANDQLAIHHNLDAWFDIGPVSGSPSWAYWPMAGVWLAHHVIDHIDQNSNKDFNEDLYTVLLKTAEFINQWLYKDESGHYITCPSTSPETEYVTKAGDMSCVSYASVMDMTLIEGFVKGFDRVSSLWHRDSPLIRLLQDKVANMPELPIHEEGYLKEWQVDYKEKDLGHRHLSHLFGFFPGELLLSKGEGVLEAGRLALMRRIEDGGDFTSWHCTWVICLLARFREDVLVKKYLNIMLGELTCPNMLSSHRRKMDGEELFQIDGNFGGTRAITELMVQDYGETIKVLPVIRSIVSEGQVSGLKVRNGHVLDISWSPDKVKIVLTGGMKDQVILEIDGLRYPVKTWRQARTTLEI